MAGLTSLGFVKKRQPEIKSELEARFRDAFGSNINLLPTEIFGQLIGIFSAREAELWDLLEGIYNSAFPDTATGSNLDNVAAITGAVRLPATQSTAIVRVFGDLGATVPPSMIFSVAGVPTSRFTSITSGVIGAGINETQKIAFSAVPASGTFKLTFDGETTTAIQYNASIGDIKAAIEALPNMEPIALTGSFASGFVLEFTGTQGASDQPMFQPFDVLLADGASDPVTVTITENQKGYGPHFDVEVVAENTGPTQAPAGTLTVIETPIFGISGSTNLLDATLGNALETDAELKLRRLESLQKSGAATVPGIFAALSQIEGVKTAIVFENTSDVEVDGRPPRSIECFLQGGDEAEIADTIWKKKPAGIQLVGNQTTSIVNNQGFTQSIKYSRPVEKLVYIAVEIIKNTDPLERGGVYPDNGDELVADAVLAYGNTFEIGQDVVLSRFYTSINTIPGVVGITIKAGFSPSPTGTANLDIDVAEVAIFDSTRITVTSA